MGYTHYWHVKPPVKVTTENDVIERVAEALDPLIAHGVEAGVLETGGDWGLPNLIGDMSFNGVGDEGHEDFTPFSVDRIHKLEDGSAFEFCKTARKPYDSYVVAALLRLKIVLGDRIELHTDGRYVDLRDGAGWGCVRPDALYQQVYDEEPPPVDEAFESGVRDPYKGFYPDGLEENA